MSFVAARLHGRPSGVNDVGLVEILSKSSGCFLFFNSTAVIHGYDVTSRFKLIRSW